MSKYVEWGVIHGEGDIVCECDHCGEEERIEFFDSVVDFRVAQKEIEEIGWLSSKVNGEWKDFCGLDCKNAFVRKNL